MAKKIILIILSQVLVKSISPYGHSLSLDKRICGSMLNIVFITREILSPLHQLLLISSLGRHHLASVVDRCHLRLLLDVVLETGVAQLLVVG